MEERSEAAWSQSWDTREEEEEEDDGSKLMRPNLILVCFIYISEIGIEW